jgi:hypothetical protein
VYDPAVLLDAIDTHTVGVLTGFGLAMVLQNVAMITAVLVTRRTGVISVPLPCTYLWFAHDLGTVARFDTWFNQYDHWFLKLFWLGLLSALVIELIFLWQAVKVGRREYLPQGTQAQWTVLALGGAAVIVVLWEYLLVIFDDPIYQAAPAITLFLLPVATTALLLRRQSAVGQAPLVYGCFAAMVPLWWGVTAGAYGGAFRSWQYLSAGVLAFGMLIAVTVAVWRLSQLQAESGGQRGARIRVPLGGQP